MARKYRLFFSLFLVAAFYIWFVWAAVTPDLPTSDRPFVFYSNQARQDLRLALREALKRASSSIHITMYALTDEDIVQLLKQKASAGVDVKVYFDPRGAETSLPAPIQSFPIKGRGLMHRKIVVIDNALVFLGSANMTTSSLVIHDNLSVGLYHPKMAQFLKSSPDHPFHFDQGELWLLPDKNALPRIKELLQSAQEKIFIAMFTLTHPELVDMLIQAHQRGVDVTLAVDYYTGRGASEKALRRLRGHGVKVLLSQGQQLLHHKWAWIDGKRLVLGSTNWTKAAFKRNQDCFLIFHDLPENQKNYIENLKEIIELEANPLIF